MKKRSIRRYLILPGIAGFVLFLLSYRSIAPETAIRGHDEPSVLQQKAESFIESLGYSVDQYDLSMDMRYDGGLLRFAQNTFHKDRIGSINQDSLDIFYWQFRWKLTEKGEDSLFISAGGDGFNVKESNPGHFLLKTDLEGNPLSLEVDEMHWQFSEDSSICMATSQLLATQLLQTLYPTETDAWILTDSSEVPNVDRLIYQFRWKYEKAVGGLPLLFTVHVQNNHIRSFEKKPEVSGSFKQGERVKDIYDALTLVFAYLFFIIFGVIQLIKYLRSDTIDLKTGLVPTLIVFVSWAIIFLSHLSSQREWGVLFGFLITVPFVCGGVWALYALGEATCRQKTPDKLKVIDGLRKKILFPDLGDSLFNGVALAGIGLGLYSIIHYISIRYFQGFTSLGEQSIALWSFGGGSFLVIAQSLFSSVYIAGAILIFFQSYLAGNVRNGMLRILVLTVFWAFIKIPLPVINPVSLTVVQNILMGFLFIYFFARFDALTVFCGLSLMPVLYYGTVILNMGRSIYLWSGLLLAASVAVLAAWIILSKRARPIEVSVDYVPDYMKRIYARERLQRELEIARHVQLYFLPRENPEIANLDIETFCVPAREVGGDYFDFVRFSDTRLGVVIGDVSGKGIPAAFYMTLAKGLFQALAYSHASPKEVLINMNRLFYQNAERGIFISVIYSIFDLEKMTLTTARAGHNPMILQRAANGATEELYPAGIALGFDKGEVFQSQIEEVVLKIQSGDIFLIYTDGLNEAQNAEQKEFGETRIMKILEEYSSDSAKDILKRLNKEIQAFAGDTDQHDDMTAVLIKAV